MSVCVCIFFILLSCLDELKYEVYINFNFEDVKNIKKKLHLMVSSILSFSLTILISNKIINKF